MKKYILVALTLGLTSTSYAATAADADTNPATLALTVLSAQSADGAFIGPIVNALYPIPENERVNLAMCISDLLGDRIEDKIELFIPMIYSFYQELALVHPNHAKAFHYIAKGLGATNIETLANRLRAQDNPGETALGAAYFMQGRTATLRPDLRMELLEGLLSERTPDNRLAFTRAFMERNRRVLSEHFSTPTAALRTPALEVGIAADPDLEAAMTASRRDTRHDHRSGGAATSAAPATITPEDTDLETALALALSASLVAPKITALEDTDLQTALRLSEEEAEIARSIAEIDAEQTTGGGINIRDELAAASALQAGTFVPTNAPAYWFK